MSRTRLGQNFLIDPASRSKIVDYFKPEAAFGEIGPGRGALTELLEKKFSNFVVFEKDEDLAALHLKNPRYKTIVGDFLDWDFCLGGQAVHNFSFIGNLPYESGSAIMQKICERADQVVQFLFMLQKEVVERIAAKPHTRDFASFTVLVQGQYAIEALDVIPPTAFKPQPKVDSQLVRGVRRPAVEAHPRTPHYRKFLHQAFMNKRKTFKNALKGRFSPVQLEKVYFEFHLNEKVRAEEIPVDLWPHIYESFSKWATQ